MVEEFYQTLNRQIANAKIDREGGCFTEVLAEIRSKATLALIIPVSDQEKISTLSSLINIVNSLPIHQTPEVVEIIYQQIDDIALFQK